MAEKPWYESFFGEDYLRIYAPFLPPERSQMEAEQIIKLLQLPPGSKVLDLCCGYGRHTLPLARQGYRMTGLDLNDYFLQQARAAAREQDLQVRWLHGSMRHIPFHDEFDAVINIFTSFGYLENDEADLEVLQQVHKALKPGGLFLLETVHQARVLRSFAPHGIIRYQDDLIVLEERQIDLLKSRYNVQISLLFPDGARREHQQSMRIYTPTELSEMLSFVGLPIQAAYGGLDGRPLSMDSRLTLVCRKAASSSIDR
ncbi:methyltransferase family protein [Thermosporothrix hazakensis]|jgi:SAM-dependent methyltransferase|uniref:Methyltransferase family protein n=2 Tax=Thermosporothrix TaxID=768650 RepID=A0A326U1I7_THEHA|nr:class I SAM-dependent methyltransferase [Thermosporothrix hazakensis]PZW24831.1 methyltransferase family protein [Thermosporothrix hazakensis]BBH88292.1 methyltransferase type 11 [Thermosporothrix sp. COM3]GCE46479.1 methyltransferase type 11 [Thermosporothrix hazakensis]